MGGAGTLLWLVRQAAAQQSQVQSMRCAPLYMVLSICFELCYCALLLHVTAMRAASTQGLGQFNADQTALDRF